MAPFSKAKEYQKLKVGAYGQEENEDSDSEINLYTTDDEEDLESDDSEEENS